jgi:hypothetical protein
MEAFYSFFKVLFFLYVLLFFVPEHDIAYFD